MISGKLEKAGKYSYMEDKLNKGYAFLQTTDLRALPLGRVEIDGDDLFANVQEYETMDAAVCKFEAHNMYFDIQYVVYGCEQFGYAKRADLEEEGPYNSTDDIVFFRNPDQCGSVLLKAGDYAVVSPDDAHRPRCVAGQAGRVRKIVLKVRV